MLNHLPERRTLVALVALYLAVLIGVIYLLRREEPRAIVVATTAPRPTATTQMLNLEVSGAVNRPGTYHIEAGARVADAVDAAGGARTDANLSALDLGHQIKNGETILVPTVAANPQSVLGGRAEVTATIPTRNLSATTASKTTPTGKVNINTASAAELEALPRIGPVMAQRIIDYRSQEGPFKTIDDIQNVKGIGEATFNALKDLIIVE